MLSSLVQRSLCDFAREFATKALASYSWKLNELETQRQVLHQALNKLKNSSSNNAQSQVTQEDKNRSNSTSATQPPLNSLLEAIYSALNSTVLIGKAILAYITSALSSFLHLFQNPRG